jgi:hypothetical protein
LVAASGKQNDNGHGGHGFDMAHVFQGCAAFGTDKGLNAAAEGNPAHNAVASSRLRRGHGAFRNIQQIGSFRL